LKALAIIPCYNEAMSIGETIEEIRKFTQDVEIWVIDNSSSDGTRSIAESKGALVLHCPTRGKGYAIRQAFSKVNSDFEVIFMVDGDHTYDIANIQSGFHAVVVDKYDMVIGRRIQMNQTLGERGAHYRVGHVTGNKVLSLLFKFLFKIDIPDTLSGWRCFSPGFVRSFAGGASGFELETELNAHIFLIKGSIKSIEVGYKGRIEGSHSKLNTYRDGARILRRIFYLFRTERPMLAYTLLGAPWFALSVVLIRNVLENYFYTETIPNFPSLIAGVGSFLVSILLWTTGLILTDQRILRESLARYFYRETSKQ
jgi:glycosyltransferase involved in cell wall biosynthesis